MMMLARESARSIAIIGTGWSGSGAVVDLFEQSSFASAYPTELDFWRRPGGVIDILDRRGALKYCATEFISSLKVILKQIVKIIVRKNNARSDIKHLFLHFFRTRVALVTAANCITNFNPSTAKSEILRMIRKKYCKGNDLFVLDQPLFIEQITTERLMELEIDAVIVVLRDIDDQIEDLWRNKSYLDAKNIREQFFIGSRDTGTKAQFLESQLGAHLLLTLKYRLTKLAELKSKHKDRLLIMSFKDLVSRTPESVDRINMQLQSIGSDNRIGYRTAHQVLQGSRKNVGIGCGTDSLPLTVNAELEKLREITRELLHDCTRP